MNKLATQHQIECMELAALNAKTDKRIMEMRLARAEAIAAYSEQRRRSEKERYRNELNGLTYGITALACVAIAIGCFATAPWWTAVAPAIFAVVFLRKAGW